MKIYAEDKYADIFAALSSATRLRIIRLLSQKTYNIKEMSAVLGLSPAIITRHIDILDNCGIVECYFTPASRGRQKICCLKEDAVTLFLKSKDKSERQFFTVPIGNYDNAQDLQAPCGLEQNGLSLGIINDPRYFMIPKRSEVTHIWFSHGMLQYRLPKQINGTVITKIKIQFMLSVECHEGKYEYGNVFFGICGKQICSHTFKTFSEPQKMCLTVCSDGIFLKNEELNKIGISELCPEVSDFTFEIGAGYYRGQKSIIGLYSNTLCPQIEIDIEVN